MENREFYDVMKEMGDLIGVYELCGKVIYPFNYVFYHLGMPEDSYLAGYDESCDYRRVFLSWYYNRCYENNQIDYQGKDAATPAGLKEEEQATQLLSRRPLLKPYIVRVSHISDYRRLIERYDLVY